MTQVVAQFESDLVDASLSGLLGALRMRATRIVMMREFAVGRSKADLVLITHLPGRDLPELSAIESSLLAAIRKLDTPSADMLAEITGIEPKDIREILHGKIAEFGLVACIGREKYRLSSNIFEKPRVYAIEAKLVRWRDAIKQALEYQRYADKSFVLMPEASPAVSNLDAFKSSGIGLLLHTGSKIRRVVDAGPSLRHDWQREFVLSRVPNV